MKKKILVLMLVFLLIAVNLYAAGDLIVEGKVGVGTTTPATTLDVQGNITILADSDIRPSTNSTTAINIAQANGTDFVTFDTTNKKVGFFNSIGAIPLTTLGADMLLNTTYVDASSQMFRARLNQQGANTTYNRVFQTGNYATVVDGASAAGFFYGMTGSGQMDDSSASVQRLFGVKATAFGNTGNTGHIDLGGGLLIEVGAADADWGEAAGIYIKAFTKTAGPQVVDYAYGIHLEKQTVGTTNAGIVLDGDGAGSDIVFGPNQNVRLYSKSDNKLYANDGINETQVSPHDPETGEWIFYSKNVKTGKVVRVDMEKLVKAVEKLTGEKFMVETMEKIEQ